MPRRAPLLTVLAALLACGGSVRPNATGNDAASRPVDASADARANDAGPRHEADGGVTLVAACPLSPPVDRSHCSTIVDCEYGSNFDVTCDTLAICDISHKWTVELPSCAAPDPGLGAGCPASFSVANAGGSCTVPGVICDFPEGRCACEVPTYGGGQQDAAQPAPLWLCATPPAAGCPSTRPRNGEACSVSSNLECIYGADCLPGSVTMFCMNGSWAGDLPPPCGGG